MSKSTFFLVTYKDRWGFTKGKVFHDEKEQEKFAERLEVSETRFINYKMARSRKKMAEFASIIIQEFNQIKQK